MNLGMLSWNGININPKILSHLGQVMVQASHNKPDGFCMERATFGDETISVAYYCFQNFSSVNTEQ